MYQKVKKQKLSTKVFFCITLIVVVMCSCSFSVEPPASPTESTFSPTEPPLEPTEQIYTTTASTVVDTINSLESDGLHTIVVTEEITNDTIELIAEEFRKIQTKEVALDLSNTTGLEYIASDAFSGCSSLTSVIIPEGVLGIGDCAFSDCSSLTRVTIPASLTYIGDTAFENCCSLTIVTIPEGVMFI